MFNKLAFFALFLLLVSTGLAQKKQKAGLKSRNMGSMVTYLSQNDSVNAYLVMPDGEGPFPTVILVHEWWGLNDWVKNNADQFAKKGYAALAIDLYRGNVTDKPDEAHEYSRALDQEQGVRDVIAAYNYIKTVKGVDSARIGSIGWCMGGTYSLQAAIYIPDLKAAVVCYGGLSKDPEILSKINAPVLGIFGEEDKGIPPQSVKEFENIMKEHGKQITIYDYPKVGHAFMNENNKAGYNKKTTTDAWKQIWSFFDKNLKGNNTGETLEKSEG